MRLAVRIRALRLAPVLVVYGAFLAFAVPYVLHCAHSAWPGGWDGVGHYAAADLYTRKIFPSLSGWLPEYFAGMPFPTYYPPLFYVTVALLAPLLGVKGAFLALLVASTLSIPLLLYLCARRLSGSELGAVVAMAIGAGMMLDRGSLHVLGISLFATFEIGLCTHAFSFCWLLVAYFALLSAERGPRRTLLVGVLVSLVVLSNGHVVWNALFVFSAHAIAETFAAARGRRLRVLGRYATIAGVAFLASAVWLVPMLAHLALAPTVALAPPARLATVQTLYRVLPYLVAVAVAAWTSRKVPLLALVVGLLCSIVFAVAPVRAVFADLALQPGRVLVGIALLAPIAIGALPELLGKQLGWRHAPVVIACLCVVAFAVKWQPVRAPSSTIEGPRAAAYTDVLSVLRDRTDGRVLVELGDTLAEGFAMQSLVGSVGAQSLTTVFREASLDVFFTVPLRNLLSARKEEWGIDTKLPHDKDQLPVLDEATLARLRVFDARYVVAQSELLKNALRGHTGAERLSPAGPSWEVWAIAPPAPAADVLRSAPVLTFAPLLVNHRAEDGIDFIRLGEEAFRAGRFSSVLARSPEDRIDLFSDWARFSIALVTAYRYADVERAYAALEQFSRTHTLMLVRDADPLFGKLAALATSRATIAVVERGSAQATAAAIFDTLDEHRVAVEGAPTVKSARFEGATAEIELDAAPVAPVAVLVKQTYFPAWHEVPAGERTEAPVYLATPAFQLTFAVTSRLDLAYRRGASERAGAYLGLLGLLVAAFLAWPRPVPRDEAER